MMSTKELGINHDFLGLQHRSHSWAGELYATPVITGEMTALCYSCHDCRVKVADRQVGFDRQPDAGLHPRTVMWMASR